MKKLHLFLMITGVLLGSSETLHSQSSAENVSGPIPEWHHKDRVEDSYNGVSTEKAYELLKGKKSETVIVAVIDSGLDIDHEDLQGSLWINEDEIAGNGIDDDKNGYVDDVYGWNFLGSLEKDTYELTRVYKSYKDRFENISESEVPESQQEDYDYYLKLKKELEKQKSSTQEDFDSWKPILEMYDRSYRLLTAYIDSDTLTLQSLKSIESPDEKISLSVNFMEYLYSQEQFDIVAVREYVDGLEFLLEYGYDPEYDQRSIVGDNYEDVYEKVYGSNYLNLTANHGTVVAGIIGANRMNDLGGKGISDNVRIMGIRAVPDGDERDKDIANAIIYAVDNGAQIINMSFGKSYSPNKEAVDKAVKYAEEKGVLLVHASGNSHKNIDVKDNFPTRKYEDSNKEAENWLEIGASSWGEAENFVATFSNYGKESVDVFAPGVSIYSTTPGSLYDSQDGTSFAAPIVSGIAALIMSYYPNLTAIEVKEIILDSSINFNKLKVNKPADYGAETEEVKFSDLSRTGGIVNAYEAVKMAEARSLKKTK